MIDEKAVVIDSKHARNGQEGTIVGTKGFTPAGSFASYNSLLIKFSDERTEWFIPSQLRRV